jgi:hypothetical protein
MDIRKLPAGQALAWFKQAIDLGGNNPRGVFGAAILMIATFYGVAMLLLLPMIGLTAGLQSDEVDMAAVMTRVMPMVAVMVVAVSLLVPFLVGGFMHVLRENEAGGRPGALQVFHAFRAPQRGSLLLVGLVMLAVQVLGNLLVMLAGGTDYMAQYAQMMQAILSGADPATIEQPRTPLLMFVLQLAVNYIAYAILLFSVPLLLFHGAGLREALAGSLRAAGRNLPAYLLALALFVVGMIVALLLFLLVAALAALVGGAIHGAVGSALTVLLALAFACAVLVVALGAAYLAWRDTFDAAPRTPATRSEEPVAGFEA